MNKPTKWSTRAQKAKMQMLPSITLKIFHLAGMANLYLIGCINFMGSVSSTNAKFVGISVIGVGGHSKCISRSGGILME